jgi:hypothetical protein
MDSPLFLPADYACIIGKPEVYPAKLLQSLVKTFSFLLRFLLCLEPLGDMNVLDAALLVGYPSTV